MIDMAIPTKKIINFQTEKVCFFYIINGCGVNKDV